MNVYISRFSFLKAIYIVFCMNTGTDVHGHVYISASLFVHVLIIRNGAAVTVLGDLVPK